MAVEFYSPKGVAREYQGVFKDHAGFPNYLASFLTSSSLSSLQERCARNEPSALLEMAVAHMIGEHGVQQGEQKSQELLQQAAVLNDPDAQFQVGLAEVQQQKKSGASWLEKAMLQGHPTATYFFACALRAGVGASPDPSRGLKLLQTAAQQGLPRAQVDVAMAHLKGTGTPRNLQLAFSSFEQACRSGDSYAQAMCGLCYALGVGVQVDEKHAVELFARSAAQKDPCGQYLLAMACMAGKGTQQDEAKGLRLLRESAGAKDRNAMVQLARLAMTGVPKDEKTAFLLLTKIHADHALAALILNSTHLHTFLLRYMPTDSEGSLIGSVDNVKKMLKEYYKDVVFDVKFDSKTVLGALVPLAEAGDPEMQFALAQVYFRGKFVEHDSRAGVKWLKLAAEQGHSLARTALKYKASQGGVSPARVSLDASAGALVPPLP